MPQILKKPLPPLMLGDQTIGQRIVAYRKEQGLTQVQLAGKIGINQVLVSEYERDKIRINAEMLARFAIALGVSADVLLGLTDAVDQLNLQSRRLTRLFKQADTLAPRQKKAFLDNMEVFLAGLTSNL